jgi:hypothetical protein
MSHSSTSTNKEPDLYPSYWQLIAGAGVVCPLAEPPGNCWRKTPAQTLIRHGLIPRIRGALCERNPAFRAVDVKPAKWNWYNR